MSTLHDRDQPAIPEDLPGQLLDQVSKKKIFLESGRMVKSPYLEEPTINENEIRLSSIFPPASSHLPLPPSQPPADHAQVFRV